MSTKPKFDVRKSLDCLLDILTHKSISVGGQPLLAILSKKERMDVINAGLAKRYKHKEKPGSRINNSSTGITVLKKSFKDDGG